jgi:GNAT superfamily N-acetyltransferase
MPITIRDAVKEDLPAVMDILLKLGWFAHLGSEPADKVRRRMERHLELCLEDRSHSVYMAECDLEVAGYISVHWLPYLFLKGPEGYVSELFVAENFRGQGIGTKLLEKVKEEGSARGCSRLALINNRGRESYDRKYYEKNGWTERAEMANFIFTYEL